MCDRWLQMLSLSQSIPRTVTVKDGFQAALVGRNDKRIAWKVFPAQFVVQVAGLWVFGPQFAYTQWDQPFTGKPNFGSPQMAFDGDCSMDYQKHGDMCQRELFIWNSAITDATTEGWTMALTIFETLLPCPVHQYIQNGFKVP